MINKILLFILLSLPLLATAQQWRRVDSTICIKTPQWKKDSVIVTIEITSEDTMFKNFSRFTRISIQEMVKNYKVRSSKINIRRTFSASMNQRTLARLHHDNPVAKDSTPARFLDPSEPMIYNQIRLLSENAKPSVGTELVSNDEKDTITIKRRVLRQIHDLYYFYHRPYRASLQVGVRSAALFNSRVVLINDPSFSNHQLIDKRAQEEKISFSHSLSLTAGITIGRNHYIYGQWMPSTTRGFRAENSHGVDWATGLPASAPRNFNYLFRYNGVGLGYMASSDYRVVNVLFDFGVSFYSLRSYTDASKAVKARNLATDPLTKNINRADIVLHAGLGLKIVPGINWSIQVLPQYRYSLRPINSAVLKTKLVSFGIEVGAFYNFRALKK